MIEEQSENINNAEEKVSEKSDLNEDSSLVEDQTNEDKELPEESKEKINADDLKNTISNNDARLEQLLAVSIPLLIAYIVLDNFYVKFELLHSQVLIAVLLSQNYQQ